MGKAASIILNVAVAAAAVAVFGPAGGFVIAGEAIGVPASIALAALGAAALSGIQMALAPKPQLPNLVLQQFTP